jgi:YD repeat-containing protein
MTNRLTGEQWGDRRTTFGYAALGTATYSSLQLVTFDANTSFTLTAAATKALGASTAQDAADAFGRITDGLARNTDFLTDGAGRLTALTLGDGGVWTYDRNWAGQVTRFEDPLGQETFYEYDETFYEYDAEGDLVQITLPDESTQEFTYDSTFHRVTSVTNEEGLTTTYTYNAYGDLETVTGPDAGSGWPPVLCWRHWVWDEMTRRRTGSSGSATPPANADGNIALSLPTCQRSKGSARPGAGHLGAARVHLWA